MDGLGDGQVSVVGQNSCVRGVCGALQKQGLKKIKGVWRQEAWQDFSTRVGMFGYQGKALEMMTQNT